MNNYDLMKEFKNNLAKFKKAYPESQVVKEEFGKESIKLSENLDTLEISQEDLEKIVHTVVFEGINKKKILMSNVIDFEHLPFPNIIFSYRAKEGWMEKVEFHTNVKRKELTATLFQFRPEWALRGYEYVMMYRYRWTIQDIDNESGRISADDQILDVSQFCDTEKLLQYVKEDDARYIDMGMWRFFYVNYFVRAMPTSYTTKNKEIQETIATGKGANKKYKHVTKIVHEYTINIKNKTKKELNKIITCPAWGVRGHFRTLFNKKTGKYYQVFVKPYVKGKERNNAGAYIVKNYEL